MSWDCGMGRSEEGRKSKSVKARHRKQVVTVTFCGAVGVCGVDGVVVGGAGFGVALVSAENDEEKSVTTRRRRPVVETEYGTAGVVGGAGQHQGTS